MQNRLVSLALNEETKVLQTVSNGIITFIHRWGPNSVEVECIKRHLESQGVKLEPPIVSYTIYNNFIELPFCLSGATCHIIIEWLQVGGVELDVAFLLETVQKLGGVQYIVNKNKWSKVADILKIPKAVSIWCHSHDATNIM